MKDDNEEKKKKKCEKAKEYQEQLAKAKTFTERLAVFCKREGFKRYPKILNNIEPYKHWSHECKNLFVHVLDIVY
jgi:hypothetical protein